MRTRAARSRSNTGSRLGSSTPTHRRSTYSPLEKTWSIMRSASVGRYRSSFGSLCTSTRQTRFGSFEGSRSGLKIELRPGGSSISCAPQPGCKSGLRRVIPILERVWSEYLGRLSHTRPAPARWRLGSSPSAEESRLLGFIAGSPDPEGEEFALAGQRQQVISRLRGRGVGRQPAPAFRETLIFCR
jgi:hypothetical protein